MQARSLQAQITTSADTHQDVSRQNNGTVAASTNKSRRSRTSPRQHNRVTESPNRHMCHQIKNHAAAAAPPRHAGERLQSFDPVAAHCEYRCDPATTTSRKCSSHSGSRADPGKHALAQRSNSLAGKDNKDRLVSPPYRSRTGLAALEASAGHLITVGATQP